ncbi:TatD family hydrolase [Acidihalobacter prosperus]|uniref:DNAase n=1 Tax=Acidihalobacter prosperus TaxID=160660 RepID=A0A1A6C495_9GAMM|nr:TatD family hydrolase [Acidihalobacter prosperus]OBS09374.1 hypothetical protein Thpro_021702 [Acidihalobacter prosperus]
MIPALVDSHCHLDAPAFDNDREDVLARARRAGVGAIILPAVTAAGWPRLRALAASHAGLYPAYGLHPMFVSAHRPAHLDALGEWLAAERPVAVGECGLDYYVPGLDADAQMRYFDAQLALARERNLPVIVHARKALDRVIQRIRRQPGLRGVVHSFSGSLQQAMQLHDAGFCVGLGGPLTYPRAQRLRRIAAALPLEAILLETDAPDQPGHAHRGERNEPAFIREVLADLAALRDTDSGTIAAATTANTCRLFGLPAARETAASES